MKHTPFLMHHDYLAPAIARRRARMLELFKELSITKLMLLRNNFWLLVENGLSYRDIDAWIEMKRQAQSRPHGQQTARANANIQNCEPATIRG